ncbi:MAG: ParA family protein [Eubacteriales bacterium]
MARVLELFQSQYDYILIDCGHSMDLLTINALAAAHQAIVPVQAHYLAMEDMADTLEVIQTIRQGINPKLAVGGILLTMYQGRTNLCRGIQDEIQADYGNAFTVFSSPIDFSIRVAEHPIGAASIFAYEPNNLLQRLTPPSHKRCYPMARNKVQDALRQRKRSEAEAAMANGPPEEGAYQCFSIAMISSPGGWNAL